MTNSEKITCDAGNLYRAFQNARESSPKKCSTKRMSQHVLDEIKRAQDELHNRTWTIEKLKPLREDTKERFRETLRMTG